MSRSLATILLFLICTAPAMPQPQQVVPERIAYCVVFQWMSGHPDLLYEARLSIDDERAAEDIVRSFTKQFMVVTQQYHSGRLSSSEFSVQRDSLVSATRRQLGLQLSQEGLLRFVGFVNRCRAHFPPSADAYDPVV
jgi:hypothetical protein